MYIIMDTDVYSHGIANLKRGTKTADKRSSISGTVLAGDIKQAHCLLAEKNYRLLIQTLTGY